MNYLDKMTRDVHFTMPGYEQAKLEENVVFEDFQTSLTGKEKGRQEDYNRFIKEKADIVIFVFSSIAGRITEEFDVAYNSFQTNNRPEIFVYVKKQFFIFDKRLRNIKERFSQKTKNMVVLAMASVPLGRALYRIGRADAEFRE